jgi:hypothetical protein
LENTNTVLILEVNDMHGIPPIAIRNSRVQKAVALEKPDRVPFMPSLGNVYCLEYGISIYEVMKDIKAVIPAMDKLCEEINPDLLFAPNFYPIDTMEIAKASKMGWPKKTPTAGENEPFQVMDATYLEDDDWDIFLNDPTAFLLHKVLPKKYTAFDGLRYLNVHGLCGTTPLALAGAGIPMVKEALTRLIAAADAAMDYLGGLTAVCMHAVDKGYPVWGNSVILNPFDEFADCIRGLMATVMDLKTDPELLNEAVTRWADVAIPAGVAQAKMMHAQYSMIPLHCGVDEFMSPSDYEKYYWPSLKRLMSALISANITPVVLCEGNYYTRLETLTDVPKGKIIYMFEKTDMKKAKRILGGTACIAGNISTQTLMYGTVREVAAETMQLIDMCADGGGYIMSNAMSIDNAKRENLKTWYETTICYGKYDG